MTKENEKIEEAELVNPEISVKKEEIKKEVAISDTSFSLSDISSLNFDQAWRIASCFAKSGMLPKAFNTPEKIIIGLQYARELNFASAPLTAMKSICIINGTPSIWGDLPLGMVFRSGRLKPENIREYFIDEHYNEVSVKNKNINAKMWAAVCEITVGNVKKECVFSVDDAAMAGLLKKDTYKGYPKIMFKRRARATILKDLFPDVLNGVGIAEYDHHTIPDDKSAGQKIEANDAIDVESIIEAAQDK